MSIKLYPEFYNDVFGPISNPGSSSHMSGPCRAGHIAYSMLGEDVSDIKIFLDRHGSFSDGFGQMNEDIGMLNGAYGNLPDSEGFFDIRLYLEWTAPEDYPASSDGKKIGTGPYIAKFNTEVSGAYVAKVPDKGDNMVEIKDKDTFTRTFGFRRLKK